MNVHATGEPWPVAPRLPAREVDPIVLQIVEGTLNSIEAEIEYAIERTARSPMIREAHDYRVGLFDRYCRKLTGRSYSAMPNAVVRDFPPETMQPGDVYITNDPWKATGHWLVGPPCVQTRRGGSEPGPVKGTRGRYRRACTAAPSGAVQLTSSGSSRCAAQPATGPWATTVRSHDSVS